MDAKEKKRLEDQGYMVVEDAADWLGLDETERKEIALRRALGYAVRQLRTEQGLTQAEAAPRAKTNQSTWAAIEMGIKPSLDLMFRAFFALGGTIATLELGSVGLDVGGAGVEARKLAEQRTREIARKVERPRSKAKKTGAKS